MIGSISISSPAKAAPSGWLTFHDPVYGYTLQYPSSWLLTPEKDGSHITLENPITRTSMSPDISVQTIEPDLSAPAGAIDVQQRVVAGHTGIDFTMPYLSGPDAVQGGGRARAQYRQVIFAVANTTGTYNVYALYFTSPTDAQGIVSSGAKNDNATFEHILNSFALPSTINPAADPRQKQSPHTICQVVGPSCGGGSGCDAVCWADANWNYNTIYDTGYSSSNQQAYDCDKNGYNSNLSCVDQSQTNYGATAIEGRFQPNFQCANFVSRALTEEGLIPCMANGGVLGSSTTTGINGNYSYGSYPFTYYANAGSGTHNYDLVWVGTRGSTGPEPVIDGLFEYLLDSGLGVNIGENVAAASPGDVVFFEGTSTPGPNDREHVMLITSLLNNSWTGDGAYKGSYKTGGYDAILDGHNESAYHDQLDTWAEPNYSFKSFEIIHIRSAWVTVSGTPTPTGPQQWVSSTDSFGQSMQYVPTTNQWGSATNWAKWDYTGDLNCAVIVYVPASNYASANPARFEVETYDNVWHQTNFDENTVYGMVQLYKWGDLSTYAPIAVYVPNEDGSTSHYLGVSNFFYVC